MDRYKLKRFAEWARKIRLSDEKLLEILKEMDRGLMGDRLGADVYKKRVPIGGRGKRGGARSIVLYRKDEVVLFMYGYAKHEKSDLTLREERALRLFAHGFLKLSAFDRALRVAEGSLLRVAEGEP